MQEGALARDRVGKLVWVEAGLVATDVGWLARGWSGGGSSGRAGRKCALPASVRELQHTSVLVI